MRHLKKQFAGLLLALVSSVSYANNNYPDRPIHLIVGFPAGGASDVAARAFAKQLSVELGQQIVVENKPGAASNIASSYVAKSNKDGHTLLFGTISLAINNSLYSNLNYDARKDFIPVSQLSSAPFILVANNDSPFTNVTGIVASAGNDKSLIHYASAGNGSGSHLFMELFANKAGIKLSHVPYRGAAPAMVDVMAGQVPLTFDNIMTTLSQVNDGKVRALAVSTNKRAKAAPSIPTLEEEGIKGYDATSWFGLFAPANTPVEVIEKINIATKKAVNTQDVVDVFENMGAEVVGSSSSEFSHFFQSEIEKWKSVVEQANVKVD